MDWCKLQTDYYLDAAILRAGEPAEVLFLRCIAYSGAMETRGRIPRHVLPMLTPTRTAARVKALLGVNLLVEDGDDLLIRSWSRIQESLDAEAERRRRDRERKAAERSAKKSTDMSMDSSSDSPRTVRAKIPRKEVEVEVEEKTSVASLPDRFDEFWDTYPRRVARGQAVKAWKMATRKVEADVILTAASVFAESVRDKDPTYIAHPATWLNGERWLDAPVTMLHPSGPQDPRHTRLRGVRL